MQAVHHTRDLTPQLAQMMRAATAAGDRLRIRLQRSVEPLAHLQLRGQRPGKEQR